MALSHKEQPNSLSSREAVLTKIRNIVGEHLRGIPAKVYLYGSWARQEERPTSDIDLAIWPGEPLPTGTLAKLRSALEEAPIPYPVEVVDLLEADQTFIQQVIKEGIEWNEWNNV
ncbi:nucleotidyltransferase family protein [Effusibacillus lacus]|uniref:Polymerase beta nucleotidyltransferase domain-containing protein n=1 Tax=Effusibacillus lacus TaxID=1348429 RepID=A0A292YPJ3_9BACL|nr:nucleotidyltransferase domain-containing protein [Effusibacillus lacus]TCS74174.1 nucleotidyltransferase-like protein [Effusibacillus lacus]GAX90829.1 hypothetical protein EFBL_2471 [Effusibacillus lacus]